MGVDVDFVVAVEVAQREVHGLRAAVDEQDGVEALGSEGGQPLGTTGRDHHLGPDRVHDAGEPFTQSRRRPGHQHGESVEPEIVRRSREQV